MNLEATLRNYDSPGIPKLGFPAIRTAYTIMAPELFREGVFFPVIAFATEAAARNWIAGRPDDQRDTYQLTSFAFMDR